MRSKQKINVPVHGPTKTDFLEPRGIGGSPKGPVINILSLQVWWPSLLFRLQVHYINIILNLQ